jgi:hypothetical protein
LYSNRPIVSKEGNAVHLPCDYKGRPEPTIHWMHSGQRLYPETKRVNKTTQLANGTWYMSYTERQDSGLYTCVLNNTYGIAVTDVSFTVAKGESLYHGTCLIQRGKTVGCTRVC